MLYIAKWDVPSADDYNYGVIVHDIVLNNGTVFDIIRGAAENTKTTYYNWQGTASAVFLFSLVPASFGEQYYVIVPYIMLFSLITGICTFMTTLCRLFTNDKKYGWIIAIVILVGCTQFLPSPVQGFYWYNGAILYTFFFGISLIFYSLIIKSGLSKINIGKQIVLCFLGVFIALGNYITALTTAILLVSFLCFRIWCRNDKWKSLILPIIFYGFAFYLNISAPGNSIRQSNAGQSYNVILSIAYSFRYAITQITKWNKIPVLALYLLLCPVLWTIAAETDYKFKFPWLVTIYSYCLFSSMNCPNYYTFGYPGDDRIENIRYFAMIILIVINIFYWLGWLQRHISRFQSKKNFQLSIGFLLLVFIIFTAGNFTIASYRITSFSAVQSYYLGQVGQYKHVYNQRLEILKDPEIKDAVLKEYPRKKPFVLYFSDISSNPDYWANKSMSDFYHKNSVRLRTVNDPE